MALTIKQEDFCLAYIEVKNASEAFRRAYKPKTTNTTSINRLAKKLLDNVKVMARVTELRASALKRHQITVDDLLDELDENRKAALGAETVQSAAATTATMAKAKLLGLLTDKVEHTGRDGQPIQSINHNMTAEQYAATLKQALDEV